MILANCLDNSSVRSFSLISICLRMKDVDITAGCPFLAPVDEELLDEEAIELTAGGPQHPASVANLRPLEGYKVLSIWSLVDLQPSYYSILVVVNLA